MNKPDRTEPPSARLFGRLRFRRRTREERVERQLKKAHQLAAMQSERGRVEGKTF